MTDPKTIVVTVERTNTATITRLSPAITTVVQPSSVATIVSPPPDVVSVEKVDGRTDLVEIPRGPVGPQGPTGPQGPSGAITGTTDNLPEGTTNLYYTDARAEAVANSAAIASMSVHLANPDPHPQYVDGDDIIDGGNF